MIISDMRCSEHGQPTRWVCPGCNDQLLRGIRANEERAEKAEADLLRAEKEHAEAIADAAENLRLWRNDRVCPQCDHWHDPEDKLCDHHGCNCAPGALLRAEEALQAMRAKAATEPINVDISDYGDEWCAGFLVGQENALDEFARAALSPMDYARNADGSYMTPEQSDEGWEVQ